jgi:pyocin large subunit-like protein
LPARAASRRLLVWALSAIVVFAAGPGFRTKAQFEAHYRKHGSEFGKISRAEYLRLAQELRDAPPGPDILQAVRPDGVITKFDRRRRFFGAYNPDSTIRTFFVPVDGERYFRRQAARRPFR